MDAKQLNWLIKHHKPIQEGKWATLLKEFYAPSDMTYSCNVSHKI